MSYLLADDVAEVEYLDEGFSDGYFGEWFDAEFEQNVALLTWRVAQGIYDENYTPDYRNWEREDTIQSRHRRGMRV